MSYGHTNLFFDDNQPFFTVNYKEDFLIFYFDMNLN